MIAYTLYLAMVRTFRLCNPEISPGQAHALTLAAVCPDIARQVTEQIDPYLAEDRLPAFLRFVRERLGAS